MDKKTKMKEKKASGIGIFVGYPDGRCRDMDYAVA